MVLVLFHELPSNQGRSPVAQSLRHNASRVLRRFAFDRHGGDTRLDVLVTIEIPFVLHHALLSANQTVSWLFCLSSSHVVARRGAEFHNFV